MNKALKKAELVRLKIVHVLERATVPHSAERMTYKLRALYGIGMSEEEVYRLLCQLENRCAIVSVGFVKENESEYSEMFERRPGGLLRSRRSEQPAPGLKVTTRNGGQGVTVTITTPSKFLQVATVLGTAEELERMAGEDEEKANRLVERAALLREAAKQMRQEKSDAP